jgi:hypothetical protein
MRRGDHMELCRNPDAPTRGGSTAKFFPYLEESAFARSRRIAINSSPDKVVPLWAAMLRPGAVPLQSA